MAGESPGDSPAALSLPSPAVSPPAIFLCAVSHQSGTHL